MSTQRIKTIGSQIIAINEDGYGNYEFDLKDVTTGKYIGLVLGTVTRNGIIWDIQKWRNGKPTGAIMRLPVETVTNALQDAAAFCQ